MPAQKLPVEFGEWRPDVALLDTKFASEVENVFAGVNSYLPFPIAAAVRHTPLPGRPAGCTPARTTAGSGKSTPAPATKLYMWCNLGGWADISRTVGGAYNVSRWRPVGVRAERQPARRGAMQRQSAVDQHRQLARHFADLPGSPPRADQRRADRRLSVPVGPAGQQPQDHLVGH